VQQWPGFHIRRVRAATGRIRNSFGEPGQSARAFRPSSHTERRPNPTQPGGRARRSPVIWTRAPNAISSTFPATRAAPFPRPVSASGSISRPRPPRPAIGGSRSDPLDDRTPAPASCVHEVHVSDLPPPLHGFTARIVGSARDYPLGGGRSMARDRATPLVVVPHVVLAPLASRVMHVYACLLCLVRMHAACCFHAC
jgi:hypothetical protein